MKVDIALIEWPGDPGLGGPRLIGRIDDPDLVEAVRRRIVGGRLRELARLTVIDGGGAEGDGDDRR